MGIDIDEYEKEQIIENSYGRYEVYQLKSNNWDTALFKVHEESTNIFQIKVQYSVDIPQKYLIAPINSNSDTGFLLFDWKSNNLSIRTKFD